MRDFALAGLLALAAGCQDVHVPDADVSDAGSRPDAARAPIDRGPRSSPLVPVEDVFSDGTLAIEPSAGWISPPSCPTQYADSFCSACYEWPSGPESLDRNEDGDRFGASMAIADFNNDGYPDLAIGAPGEDVGSNVDAGAVYVYLGTARGFEPWEVLHYEPGYGSAPAGMQFGTQLAAGDIDEDGYADLAIALGPNQTDQWIEIFRGFSYGVFPYWEVRLFDIDPYNWETPDSEFGAAMALADVDGDAHVDLVIGAPGQLVLPDNVMTGAVYVVYGDGTELQLTSSTRLVPSSLSTVSAGMRFGEVLAVGKLTGSGLDIAVGVSGGSGVYVYESDGNPLVLLSYPDDTGLGASLAAGDYDGAGNAELFAGGTGTTYVAGFTGLDSMGGYATWDLDDALVGSARGLADLDAPGTPQLLVQWNDSGFVTNPVVGVADLSGTTVAWSFHIGESVPRESDDAFGRRAIVADVDGNGLTDVIVAAPSEPGSGAGRVYVFEVKDSADWTDTMHWESVWSAAGYEYVDPGDPPYTDPMPVQVITQETTPGDCDLCGVFGWSDGTSCGDTDAEICVSGACFTRMGCGDGYREPDPGSMTWPREGCDDGNVLDGDACSSTCVPTRVVVSSQPLEEVTPGWRAPAIAEDGMGQLLFVYTADSGGDRELRARRYSAGGVALEEDTSPIVIATGFAVGWSVQPTVAGRGEGGWVVGWVDPAIDAEDAGIAMRRVAPDGTMSSARRVNTQVRGPQREPRAFAFDGGYGFAWVDEGGVDGPLGGSIVKVAGFDSSGAVYLPEFAISASDTTASEPAVATGDGALFVWTQQAADEAELSQVMGTYWGESMGAPFAISGPAGSQPAVVAPNGAFAVAWVRRDPAYDYRGDIQLGVVDVSSGSPVLGTVMTVVEETRHPELAPSVALMENGAVVAYEDGGHRRGVAFVDLFGSGLAPESTALAGYLRDGLQGDVTLLSTGRGVWFAWSDASDFMTPGDPEAYRSFFAFLLPHN